MTKKSFYPGKFELKVINQAEKIYSPIGNSFGINEQEVCEQKRKKKL